MNESESGCEFSRDNNTRQNHGNKLNQFFFTTTQKPTVGPGYHLDGSPRHEGEGVVVTILMASHSALARVGPVAGANIGSKESPRQSTAGPAARGTRARGGASPEGGNPTI